MSLDKCIPGLVFEGKITPEQGRRYKAVYGKLQQHYRRSMAGPAADALASEAAVTAIERAALQSKRQMLLQVKAQKRMLVDLASFDGGSGKHPGAAALALFDHEGRAPYMNVEAQRKAIVGRAHALMTDVLFKHSRNILGQVRDKAGLYDLVRGAFGEPTETDAGRELADAWTQTAEMLRMRFNAAGGAIGKLENWGLPQSHDSDRVRAAGWEAWRDVILPKLDPTRMTDQATGKPFAPRDLELALHDVFDTIRSDGLNKINPGGTGGRSKLANTRAESRFLVFKSADDWIAYSHQFGTADPFDAMMGHISGMARDIAHMEVLGPNPSATVRWLQDGLTKAAAIDRSADGAGRAAAVYLSFRLGQMFETTSGALSSPVNPKIAYVMGSTRSLMTAAKLGAAQLSAVTDVGFQAITRAYNGLPIARALTGYLNLLNPASTGDRRMAVRFGLIAQEASAMASTQNRYLGEAVSGELASRLAEGVLRASGLSAWTQAGRWAFGMDMLATFAHHLDEGGAHAFDKLDDGFRGMIERYGIDAQDWDKLRATKLYDHQGATFLNPRDVADQALGDKILRAIHSETAYAVPETTVRSRSLMTFGRPGSLAGEVSRNFGLFKGFGVSVIMNHGARVMQAQGYNGATYAAGLIVTTTLLGAWALQSKEVSKGRDPRKMTGLSAEEAAAFWGAAMLQGGGFGIMGDFLGQATSDRASGGGTFGDALAGPVVGLATDVGALTLGNAATAIRGKDPHVGADATRFLKSYAPGSSLWYGRLAMDRLVWDQLQMQIDPQYPSAFRRMHQRARETGQDFWWDPGETAPDRAPAGR